MATKKEYEYYGESPTAYRLEDDQKSTPAVSNKPFTTPSNYTSTYAVNNYGLPNYMIDITQNDPAPSIASKPYTTFQARPASNLPTTPANPVTEEPKHTGGGGGGGIYAPEETPVYNGTYTDTINGLINGLINGNGQYNLPEWNEKAPTYTSQYMPGINSLANQILNRGAFEYDYSKDPMYQQMEQSYTRNGQRAMQDTLGQMAARTGGLASSYAGSAAQQSYNNFMQGLADKIPELRQIAYNMYKDEGDNLRNNLGMLQNLENMDYSRYKDDYGQYMDRYGMYSDNWNRQFETQTQKNNDDYKLLNLLQGLDSDEYNRWLTQLGLKK